MLIVIEQFQDEEDEDGFNNVFVLNDESLVFTTEKRGIHLNKNGVVIDECYKSGFKSTELNKALDEIGPMHIAPFNLIVRNFHHMVML